MSYTVSLLNEVKSSSASAAARTSVGTTAASVLASNTSRKQVIIQNVDITVVKLAFSSTDPTQTVFHLALKACTLANDGTGGSFVSDLYQGEVRAISSLASGALVITELT